MLAKTRNNAIRHVTRNVEELSIIVYFEIVYVKYVFEGQVSSLGFKNTIQVIPFILDTRKNCVFCFVLNNLNCDSVVTVGFCFMCFYVCCTFLKHYVAHYGEHCLLCTKTKTFGSRLCGRRTTKC